MNTRDDDIDGFLRMIGCWEAYVLCDFIYALLSQHPHIIEFIDVKTGDIL